MVEKTEQLYEGKAKKVFATTDPDLVIVSYKDDATAFNGAKKGTIVGKGVVNNRMSNYLMEKLEARGIPTHYVQELSEGFFTLPEAGQVLAALPDCEHYLLTNGITEVQEKRLKGSGLAGYFREVFVSERAGAQKPDPRFFEYAFSQIPGFELGRALMIGDSLSADMAGARGVGLACCWFNPEGKPAGDFRPDFEIRTLPEVLPIVLGE